MEQNWNKIGTKCKNCKNSRKGLNLYVYMFDLNVILVEEAFS